jgi:diacylglycerol kinase (ATP)
MSPRRPLFVVNPAARGGRAARLLTLVRRAIAEHGGAGEVVCTERAGHATALAREAASAGFDAVIGVGGDGTLQEIANGLVTGAQLLPIGAVPTGSGNDFVRSLGLPTAPSAAVALAWSTAERLVDLAACGERYFINVGGAGFDARVARAAYSMPSVLRFGAVPYVAGVLRELMHNTAHELRIHLNDRTLQRRALMVAVANGAFYGGGMMICPEASRDDGLLDLCVVGAVSRPEVLRLLSAVFSGKHVGDPHVEFFRTRMVRIESAQPCELHLDGELAGTLPAEFRAVPQALRVLVRAC